MTESIADISYLKERAEAHRKLAEKHQLEANKHQQESTKHLELYQSYTKVVNDILELDNEKNNGSDKKIMKRTRRKLTFNGTILNILKDQQPRTVRELMSEYHKIHDKELTYDDFSSRLSQFKMKGNIKIHEFPNNPVSAKNYYGLAEWFDGNKLKKEFLDKIEQ